MPAIDLATAKAAQGLITGHTGPVSSRTELPVPGERGQDTGPDEALRIDEAGVAAARD